MLVALGIDRWLGEPALRWHPVVWMGKYLQHTGAWVQARTRQTPGGAPDYKAFWLSALAWCAGAALILIAAVVLQSALAGLLVGALQGLVALEPVQGVQGWRAGQGVLVAWGEVALAVLLLGGLLKPLLAWALLTSEVLAVEHALDATQGGSLAAGRERLRWLVSRDVAALGESQVRESAIETLAENLNDSVVAPLFWFVLLGLPGAALFRFANTADAMWGYPGVYQGRNWEWAGKWAAHADDLLGWLPARITGVVLLLVALGPARAPGRGRGRGQEQERKRETGNRMKPRRGGASPLARLRQLQREAAKTPSPNSGWPMAAMALGLDVALRKPGGYALNAAARAPLAQDTRRAVIYASNTLLALAGCVFIAIISIALWSGLWA